MHCTTLYMLCVCVYTCVRIEIYILKCTKTGKRKIMTAGRREGNKIVVISILSVTLYL